ncbi:MAG: hypothetical protein A2583_01350 [Bdellovibrionales bacterium RIFOXYD1_FULL_53_11]|nr:MAG: hypothetical protein A2583_01350 [Bdellovibrionales bacterium RIFOXYD1_FULL_53_11]
MLEIKSVSKSFGKADVLRDISLTIKEGEFFSLLGPSGCGKTTLLRLLGGFDRPGTGEIHHNGVRIDTLPANQRRFNMVFQRYALFPHLSVRDNVAFGLRMKKVASREIASRVDEMLSLVQMAALASRSVTTLSGGQQQRVALARALVNRPEVLLLDEPLSALDLKLRQQMQVELLALQRRLKHTFIFVTHDQEEALTLSDRIAVMNDGVIDQVGTPQEIYEYPRTPFVARFIGSVNAIDGEIKDCRPDVIIVGGPTKRMMTVRPSRDGFRPLPVIPQGTPIRILVRPEKFKILKSAPGPEQNALDGTIREILYQGPVTQFFVQLRDQILIIAQPNTAVTARKGFSGGDKVFVAWAPEDCLLMGRDGPLPVLESPPVDPALSDAQLQLPLGIMEDVRMAGGVAQGG